MNARLFSTIIAVLLPCFTASAAQELKVRGIAVESGVPGEEVQAHNEAGTDNAGVVKLKTFLNHEFDTLKLKDAKLVFTAKPDPASAKDPAEVLGSCEIPGKVKSVILLFLPETPGKPACKVAVVEDGAKAFPAGSIKVANLSPLPIKIELEKKSYEFKPGEIRAILNPPVGANNSSGMKSYCQRDGKWENFSSGMWPHPGDKRVLQVFFENPATKQVECRGIRDVAKP